MTITLAVIWQSKLICLFGYFLTLSKVVPVWQDSEEQTYFTILNSKC